jgi:DedD protein
MPSREPELYKDKIEVSLDGRQIFYLFFGGAVIVGMVFVLGVIIGRRVEARGHLDRAETQTANDPLAALDRLERSDNLSFHGALTGNDAPTDVEAAIGELGKRRAGKADKKPEPSPSAAVAGDGKPARSDGKPESRPEGKLEARPEARPDQKAEPINRPEADKPRSDKHDGEKKPKKHDDGAAAEGRSDAKPDRSEARRSDAKGDKPVTRPETSADGRPDAKADARPDAKPDAKAGGEARGRFTLQLSSFQDRSEAEAFLTAIKSAGYQPYLTEADVGGKGTFYRVRLGSYRSLEAANDAKAEFEKAARKTVQVMRL